MTLRLSRDHAALFAGWKKQAWAQGQALAGLALVMAVSLLLVQRRYRAQNALIATYEARRRTDQQALQRSEEQNRLIVETLNIGAMAVDLPSGQARCDDKWFAMLGFAPGAIAMTLEDWFWRIHPDDVAAARTALAALCAAQETQRLEFRIRDNNDAWHWILMRGLVVEWAGAEPRRLILAHADIAARKTAEAVLRASEARMRSLLAAMQDLVFLLDTSGTLVEYHQPVGQRPFFAGAECFIGYDYNAVLPAPVAAPLTEGIGNVLMHDTAWSFEYELPDTAGTRAYTCSLSAVKGEDAHFPVGFLGVVRDITTQKEAEAEIRRLALYDPLTHLPNRRLLDDRVAQALALCGRIQQLCALLFIDLDRFKLLNDTHGHDAGDQVLCEVAYRLKAQVRSTDTVARLGGDEFVVLLEALPITADQARKEAGDIADKIRLALCVPYPIGASTEGAAPALTWDCSSSIGVTLFHASGADAAELFRRADQAMYAAKSAGRNTVCFSALT